MEKENKIKINSDIILQELNFEIVDNIEIYGMDQKIDNIT